MNIPTPDISPIFDINPVKAGRPVKHRCTDHYTTNSVSRHSRSKCPLLTITFRRFSWVCRSATSGTAHSSYCSLPHHSRVAKIDFDLVRLYHDILHTPALKPCPLGEPVCDSYHELLLSAPLLNHAKDLSRNTSSSQSRQAISRCLEAERVKDTAATPENLSEALSGAVEWLND
ncbi:hypothetical protein BJ170DRAFT_139776 [Xylariales sp. AK1849]|nr:hypothetical protein BJ170DRAFT_139776 [Xylariales sp. AK1849]